MVNTRSLIAAWETLVSLLAPRMSVTYTTTADPSRLHPFLEGSTFDTEGDALHRLFVLKRKKNGVRLVALHLVTLFVKEQLPC